MYRTADSDRKTHLVSSFFSVLRATESWAEPGNEGRRMQLNSLATISLISIVTGNPFDWLEYSANLSDNSRSYIVGEIL